MKGMLLVVLMLLTGCAGLASLEELQSQALLSGDWTKVEQRERGIALRQLHSFVQQCPAGMASYCEAGLGGKRCACVKTDALRSAFGYR